MADDHEAAVAFEDTYNRDVQFYIGEQYSPIQTQPWSAGPQLSPSTSQQIPADFTPQEVSGGTDKSQQEVGGDTGKSQQEVGGSTSKSQQEVSHDSKPSGGQIDSVSRTETERERENAGTVKETDENDKTEKAGEDQKDTNYVSNEIKSLPSEIITPTESEPQKLENGKVKKTVPLTKEEIMAAYEEHEKMFQEDVLGITPPMQPMGKKRYLTKSISHSPGQSVGLDHLDNLVRLMEQLSQLKEENTSLRRKCIYLEDTKTLLKVRNEMMTTVSGTPIRERKRSKSQQHLKGSYTEVAFTDRCASDSSDNEQTVSRPRLKIPARSQSVGSIAPDMVDIDLDESIHYEKHHKRLEKSRDGGKFEAIFSRTKFGSRWERMKKVFGGKPEQAPKSESATISAEQLVKANSRPVKPPDLFPVKTVDPAHGASASSPPGHKEKPELKSQHQYMDPPSPSSTTSETVIPSVVTEDTTDDFPSLTETGLESDARLSSTTSTTPSEDGSHEKISLKRQRASESSFSKEGKFSGFEEEKSQFLTVQQSYLKRRRQSSPSVIINNDIESARTPKLGRVSSFKSTKQGGLEREISDPGGGSGRPKTPELRKTSRSAWGRVKDIIHTRKGSLIRKNQRSNSAGEFLIDGSTSDGEGYLYSREYYEELEEWEHEQRLHRRGSARPSPSPRESPPAARKLKSPSDSPPSAKRGTSSPVGPLGSPVDVSALMGGVSEEFTKKLQEWEDKKRKSFFRENSLLSDEASSEAKFSEEFIRKMEEWEKIKGLKASKCRSKGTEAQTLGATTPEKGATPNIDELQKHLSESFSKTVQEWQRVKTKRYRETGSPPSHKSKSPEKRSRKQERSKSRERDRSRSKYEKQREKELQKIERKEQKLQKEKQKLDQMKQRLEESKALGGARVESLSEEFAIRLHEWEVMRGLATSEVSEKMQLKGHHSRSTSSMHGQHARSNSAKDHKELKAQLRERTHSEGGGGSTDNLMVPTVHSAPPTPEANSTDAHGRSSSYPNLAPDAHRFVDEATDTDLSPTDDKILSMEEYNRHLKRELLQKDEDLQAMQDEMEQLTERINFMDMQHNETIEHFKRELWATSRLGRYTIESDLVSASIQGLREKISQLKTYQDCLMAEKAHIEAKLHKEMEDRYRAEVQKMEVQKNLPKAVKDSEEKPEEEEEETDLEKLYDFFQKLISQLSELKLGVKERNKILVEVERHLLAQEAINRLLQADICRRDLELRFLKEARRTGVIKRWKTFTGSDYYNRMDHVAPYKNKKHIVPPSPNPFYTADKYNELASAIKHLQNQERSMEDLDWHWVDRLKKQWHLFKDVKSIEKKNDDTQTEPDLLEQNMAHTSAQTVMTLCNVPYHVPPMRAPQPVRAKLDNKAIQTSLVELSPRDRGSSSSYNHIGQGQNIVAHHKPSLPYTQTGTYSVIPTDSSGRRQMEVQEFKETYTLLPIDPAGRSSSGKGESTKKQQSSDVCLTGRDCAGETGAKSRHQMTEVSPVAREHLIGFSSEGSCPTRPPRRRSRQKSGDGRSPPTSPRDDRVQECEQSLQVDPQNSIEMSFSVKTAMASPQSTSVHFPPAVSAKQKSDSYDKARQESATCRAGVCDKCFKLIEDCKGKCGSNVSERVKASYLVTDSDDDDDRLCEVFPDFEPKTPQPPHSPIIRSRYPRKLKTDIKTAQANADSRAWNATPPKRMIRHRRPSSEKRDQDELDLTKALPSNPPRERAKSDCTYTRPSSLPPTPSGGDNTDLRGKYVFRYQREQQLMLPVQDVISKFEHQSRESERTNSPTIRKPTRSPVRRLKTAAELMQDSEYKWASTSWLKQSSSDRLSPPRDRVQSLSLSDKENNNAGSKVKQMVKQFSRDNSLERSLDDITDQSSSTKESDRLRRRSSSPSLDALRGKPPLKDLTNDIKDPEGKQKETRHSPERVVVPVTRSSPSRGLSEGRRRSSEFPKDGMVSKQAEVFQEKIGKSEAGDNTERPSSRRSSLTVPKSPSLQGKPDSAVALEGPSYKRSNNAQRAKAGGSPCFKLKSCASSPETKETRQTPPQSPKPPPSPSSPMGRERKIHRLFGRKGPASHSPSRGALSSLCRSAITVDITSGQGETTNPGPSTSREPGGGSKEDGTAERRRGVGKLLDGNWFQKPKRFFKVSKC